MAAAMMTTLATSSSLANGGMTRGRSTNPIGCKSGAHHRRASSIKVHASSAESGNTSCPVTITKKKGGGVTAGAAAFVASLASAALPFAAFAEEAGSAAAASSTEISPFAGVVDITVLGVVGLLAVQGNKKAEAAKAAQGGKKGGKKKK